MKSGSRPLIVYHASCADGFCSAWIANRHFGGKADFVAANYGEPPPDVSGRQVFILDFSYKRPVLLEMAKTADTITILDHHKTALADLDGGYEVEDGFRLLAKGLLVKFDMQKSGGRLAWEYFNPGQPSPWLVEYSEDRDLWLWKLEESREVNACLASWPWAFEEWDKLAFDSTAVAHFADQGGAIIRYQDQLIAAAVAKAAELEMDGHKILCTNATCLISEIAGKLAEDRPFGATFFVLPSGEAVYSLRSRAGGVDVSEIAKKHGGGGHAQAAGFKEAVT